MTELFNEHRSLVQGGRFEDAMRLSGEALAAAEAKLVQLRERSVADEEKLAAAADFLAVASLHVSDINYAGLYRDEAALSVSVPATLLMMKINPELIADKYVYWLQMTVGRLGEILSQAGDERLEEPFWRIAGLTIATSDNYAARMELNPSLLQTGELLRRQIAALHPDEITFDDAPIEPQMAIDILVDMIAAMSSLGWIDA